MTRGLSETGPIVGPGRGGGAGDQGTREAGDLRGRAGEVSRPGPTLPRSGRGGDARGRGMTAPMGGPGAAEAARGKCARYGRDNFNRCSFAVRQHPGPTAYTES